MQTPPPPPLAPCGVSNCYVFKSRLQEYAQKVNLPTPVYETIKEGPSHEPTFRSTVIVNNVRYDSLPGFFNRKAAEQSAAEVALLALSKNGEVNECISQPVHETGLCKNLLQEYAQKMNYAIPLYECHKVETRGRANFFSCTVEIGGIRYIGAAARTKKEAEIKVARTALLAIQSSGSDASKNLIGKTELTVLPCKKRGPETVSNLEDVGNHPKAKKSRFKKALKKKLSKSKFGHPKENNTDFNISGVDVPEAQVAPLDSHAAPVEGMGNFHKLSEEPNIHLNDRNYLNGDSNNFVSQTFWSDPLSNNLGDHVNPVEGIAPITDGYASAFSNEVKEVSGVVERAPMLASDSNNIDRIADCGIMAGVNQSEDGMKAAAD